MIDPRKVAEMPEPRYRNDWMDVPASTWLDEWMSAVDDTMAAWSDAMRSPLASLRGPGRREPARRGPGARGTGRRDARARGAERHHDHHGPHACCGDHEHDHHRCEHHCDHRCGCGCGRDCGCECCIVDADVVLETLAGERRLISILIENSTHRATPVTLELSSFAGGHGIAVKGRILGPTEFTLEPCQEHEVLIAIGSQVVSAKVVQDEQLVRTAEAVKTAKATETTKVAAAAKATRVASFDRLETTNEFAEFETIDRGDEREPLIDIDRCEVAYADLRIVGCGARSTRLAVAVLPRRCSRVTIDCCCGCC